MTDIRGKRTLITGAASGLGEMLATELARAGANLVLWDIDEVGLHRVRNELAADFNGYAEGKTLLGPQIGSTTAESGTYRVTLTVGGETYEGSITVRDDPMTLEHRGR